jgi:hypothetical protein
MRGTCRHRRRNVVRRVVISDVAFGELVAGRAAVTRSHLGDEVEMILSDIGWRRMYAALDRAYAESVERAVGSELRRGDE